MSSSPGNGYPTTVSLLDAGAAHVGAGPALFALAAALVDATLGDDERAAAGLIARARAILGGTTVMPGAALTWHEAAALHAYVAGDHAGTMCECDRIDAEALARGPSCDGSRVLAAGMRGLVQATEGHTRALAATLARIGQHRAERSPDMEWWHAALHVLLALDTGDIRLARHRVPDLVRVARSATWPLARGLTRVLEAAVAFDAGQHAAARDAIDALRAEQPPPVWQAEADLLTRAVSPHPRASDSQDGQAGLLTPDLLRHCRFLGRCCARLYQRVLLPALDRDAEREEVTGLIRRYGWPGPGPECDTWPWRLRIFTLGRFAIERDGREIPFPGKAPRRPLAVLKALVSHGGRSVPLATLARDLWTPDRAGDARGALDVALVRLRRRLGIPRAIVVQDEHASLDPTLCWTDVWAFENAIADVLEMPPGTAGFMARADRVLSLYPGPFLPMEAEAPWTAVPRDRLRAAFCHAVECIGQAHENAGRWEAALECYRRGIAADALAETFYRGAMRCYLARARPGEGIAMYRQLRQTLSIVLSLKPGPETEALADRLRASGEDRGGAA